MLHYKLFESGWHSHIDASGGDWSPPKETYVAWNMNIFFPTWQVIVSRFYQSCFRLLLSSFSSGSLGLRPQPRAPELSGHCSARSQCALPDLNCESQISVGTVGPQLRALDLSGHCRVSTARARSHKALRDLNCDSRYHIESQLECQIEWDIECLIECQTECQNRCKIETKNSHIVGIFFR